MAEIPNSLIKKALPRRLLIPSTILTILLLFVIVLQYRLASDRVNGNYHDAAMAHGYRTMSATKAKPLIILIKDVSGYLRPQAVERSMLTEFAAAARLRPVWIPYRSKADLSRLMRNVVGDLVITGLDEAGADFDQLVAYTLPWGIAGQQLVSRSGREVINTNADLRNRQIACKQSSPSWPELQVMADTIPGLVLQIIPEQVDTDAVLARVSAGHYDLAVVDALTLEQKLPEFHDLEVVYKLGKERPIAWAVRSESATLRDSLNRFLYINHLKLNVARSYREDLPALQKRNVLRLITYPGPVNYYLRNGQLSGFEYELLDRFARNKGMRLAVVPAGSYEEMAALLIEGRGDVIAAFLPQGSYPQDQIAFTRYYGFSTPVVIGRKLDYPLLDRRDLQGRRLVLPAESPYRPALEQLRQSGVQFELVGTDLNTAATLQQVAAGEYDLTVIGSHQINAEFSGQTNLTSHFPLSEPAPLAWAVRAEASGLLSALNAYIESEFRQEFYNNLAVKYIDNPAPQDRALLAQSGRLSPYDEIVRKYAEQYDFDWRLIIAQMYVESRFNPVATSAVGAVGLMQLTEETAAPLGVTDLRDPDSSIQGGIKYLADLRERFDHNLLMENRTWFTLAAYNAGYGRVQRARRWAERMGLDKDKWFDNVEQAMLAMSRPYRKDGELIRDCSCGQTTHYVRELRTLYNNYVRLTQISSYATIEAGVGRGKKLAGEG